MKRRWISIKMLISVVITGVLLASILSGCGEVAEESEGFEVSQETVINNNFFSLYTAPQLYIDIENRGTDVALWQKMLDNDMINKKLASVGAKSLAEQSFDPVTSSEGIVMSSRSGNTVTANDDTYLELKIWMISTTDMWVHLSGNTVKVLGTDCTTSCTASESSGSKADVVRAVRISFEDSGSAVIWEPNKSSPVAGQTTFDVSGTLSNDTRLFHLDKLTPKQITVRIWFEGEDPECDSGIYTDTEMCVEMLFEGTDDNNNAIE